MAAQATQQERVAVVRERQLTPLFAYVRNELPHGGKAWLARKVGIRPVAHIYLIEKGMIPAPADFLERAAKALGVPVERIGGERKQRAS